MNPIQATPTPIPMPVITPKPTFVVQKGEMINEVKFTGRIAPASNQELSFPAAGQVAKVYVQRGEAVTLGQMLAELVSNQSEYDLLRAQANLKIAQLNLELAQLQTPHASNVYSVTVAIKQQEVALAQIALDELNAAYNSVHLTSPISGTVTSVSTAAGSMVEANQTVMEVANLNDLIVSADLNADQMAQLTEGMTVTVNSIGRDIPSVEGKILHLPFPYGTGEAGLTGSSAQVTLAQSPLAMGYKTGDMVNLTILLQKKENALWLPSQAVRNFEGRYFVIVQDAEGQRRVDVKVGIIEADRIEIVSGLSEGQVVVSP